ncbi:MAG: hypothetical protein M3004_11115 [Bacteroidota bacterium]|nr:hypothetical protein [Bacteroidota bacterium]
MAEIKIEKKKPIWPWILGIAAIALLLYFLLFNKNKENDDVKEQPVASDLINVHENNTTVAAYINFIQSDTNKMGLDHEFTSKSLLKLSDATNAMAREAGYDVKGNLDTARAYADQITNDPNATTHAGAIKKAADILSGVLKNMQQEKYPGLANEAGELKISSDAINPDVLTLDQRDAVKKFFSKAADILQKMN